MKIQNDNNPPPLVGGDKAASRVSSKDKPGRLSKTVEQPAVDTAETSPAAKQLEADPVRLERLREAVRSGTYSIPAGEIAARLIDEHLNKQR